MDAAIAEAQRTLAEPHAVLSDSPAGASEFGIGYPLGDGEHVWVGNRLPAGAGVVFRGAAVRPRVRARAA